MINKILALKDEAVTKINESKSINELNETKALYLGKKSPIQEIMSKMREFTPEEKKEIEEIEKWEKIHGEYAAISMDDKNWSDKPVIIQFNYLRIVLEDGKPNSYTIVTGFEDAENERMETTAHTTVDLSEYSNELKCAIIKVLVDKFFK